MTAWWPCFSVDSESLGFFAAPFSVDLESSQLLSSPSLVPAPEIKKKVHDKGGVTLATFRARYLSRNFVACCETKGNYRNHCKNRTRIKVIAKSTENSVLTSGSPLSRKFIVRMTSTEVVKTSQPDCHQQQFYPELHSPRRLKLENCWYYWAQTIY